MFKMSKISKYRENPFLDKIVIQTRGKRIRSNVTSHHIIENDTGNISGLSLSAFAEVDTEEYVKVYTMNLGMMFDLSSAAMRILNIVMRAMQKHSINKDTLYLNLDRANEISKNMNNKGIAKASFYNGIKELIDRKIIAKSVDTNLFFINPNVIFNGDRVTFMNTYQKKQDKKNQISHH